MNKKTLEEKRDDSIAHHNNVRESISINEKRNTRDQIRLTCIQIAENYYKTLPNVLKHAEEIYAFLYRNDNLPKKS